MSEHTDQAWLGALGIAASRALMNNISHVSIGLAMLKTFSGDGEDAEIDTLIVSAGEMKTSLQQRLTNFEADFQRDYRECAKDDELAALKDQLRAIGITPPDELA